ncbi:hypothetical protein ACFU76_08045 [Streptomyces sp. NPDC057539]|uniref:hypothetical protein n=1 Tax=Streptomyces sp. NPDC057539 TaxID=3346159 RepID=UPI0036AE7553
MVPIFPSASADNTNPTSAREQLISYALVALPNEPAFARCEQLADAFRAEVLREAADALTIGVSTNTERGDGIKWAARWVRSMADTRGPNFADDDPDATSLDTTPAPSAANDAIENGGAS